MKSRNKSVELKRIGLTVTQGRVTAVIGVDETNDRIAYDVVGETFGT